MSRRKAQLEIVGLVFIVLIVSLAMLFYLNYSVSKDSPELLKEYSDNELGASFATVFAKISVCDTEMNKLFQDCVGSRRLVCENGKNSCEIINETMIYLLDHTMNEWDESYGVVIRFTQNPKIDGYVNDWFVESGEGSDPANMYYFDREKWAYTRYNCTEETTGRRAPGLSLIPLGITKDSVSLEISTCLQ